MLDVSTEHWICHTIGKRRAELIYQPTTQSTSTYTSNNPQTKIAIQLFKKMQCKITKSLQIIK